MQQAAPTIGFLKYFWQELKSKFYLERRPDEHQLMLQALYKIYHENPERVRTDEIFCGNQLFVMRQIAARLKPNSVILDYASTNYEAIIQIALLFPNVQILRVDFNSELEELTKFKVEARGAKNFKFIKLSDLASLKEQSIDMVFSTLVLHKLQSLEQLQKDFCQIAKLIHAQTEVFIHDYVRLKCESSNDFVADLIAKNEIEVFRNDIVNSLRAAFSPAEISLVIQQPLQAKLNNLCLNLSWLRFMFTLKTKSQINTNSAEALLARDFFRKYFWRLSFRHKFNNISLTFIMGI